ncbi:T9SS type A sorting domain-containing protein [Mangrovimonas cancribranchiae]|uniref:T9SS type A sorting domain-containing protein n=1 Tax=Mangrovimonas cancribranchiae TaxID=3080055 RepID=A0AAU6NYV9_9FLAO
MKRLLLITVLSCSIYYGYSQQNTLTSGGDASGTNGKISYSIGEITYQHASSADGSINQGMQQPYAFETLGKDDPNIALEMVAYPNPTTNTLQLKTTYNPSELSFKLFNLNGRLILTKKFTSQAITVNMSTLTHATYILNIYKNNHQLESYKIIKK